MGTILFGAGFTVATAWCCGALLVRRLRIAELDRIERALFSFLSGAACLSVLVFFFCLAQQARPAVFLGAGILLIVGAVLGQWRAAAAQAGAGKRLPGIPASWMAVLILIVTPFFFVYFMNALAPEVSPDGSGYHLGNVARYLAHNGFVWDYHSMYSAFPQGMEMLFLFAFAFGGHSAAALVHFAFLVALLFLILSYGRRFEAPRAATFAAAVVFVSPIFGLTGASAYNDVSLATGSFAVFYLLKLKHKINNNNILCLLGLIAGFCAAIKYTGALALALGIAWLVLSRQKVAWPRFAIPAAVIALPWLIRNWLWTGDPFAPFLNYWFTDRFFSYGMEKAYLADVGRFEELGGWWRLPLEVTLYGGRIPGFLGPVFLLAPLALLALRRRHGRILLAVAIAFSIPFAFNPATRFLMPGIPFLALALGSAIEHSPGILPLLAVSQALFCWPSLTPLYAADWSWRLREIPVRAALRIEPEAAFLRRRLPGYAMQSTIEQIVPKPEKILSFSTRPEAYIDRTVLVGYESAEAFALEKALVSARAPEDARQAAEELRRHGVRFLWVDRDDPASAELSHDSNFFGLAFVKEADGTILYRLD